MKAVTKTISDAELDRQIAEAQKKGITEPEAKSARFKDGKVRVDMAAGWTFTFDPGVLDEFANASEADLKAITLWGKYTLACPPLDVHIGVGNILLHLLGEKFIESELARRRGSASSEKKSASSRENGKLGGRPRKGVLS